MIDYIPCLIRAILHGSRNAIDGLAQYGALEFVPQESSQLCAGWVVLISSIQMDLIRMRPLHSLSGSARAHCRFALPPVDPSVTYIAILPRFPVMAHMPYFVPSRPRPLPCLIAGLGQKRHNRVAKPHHAGRILLTGCCTGCGSFDMNGFVLLESVLQIAPHVILVAQIDHQPSEWRPPSDSIFSFKCCCESKCDGTLPKQTSREGVLCADSL